MSRRADNTRFFHVLPVALLLTGSFARAQMSQGEGCKDLPPALDQESVKRNPVRPVPTDIVREFHQGTVALHLQINKDGSLKEILISKSSGYRELDQAAIALAKRWQYLPAKRCGLSIDGVLDFPVTFSLPEGSTSSK